jgi:Protein of unknown function (DUF4038)/Putative collagen-binding domain of a collagenase
MNRATVGLLCLVILVASCTTPAPSEDAPLTVVPTALCETKADHHFVTSISAGGRYFLDQHGNPMLVRGDSPWAGMTRWSPEQAERYFSNREMNGFNASILSLVGAIDNGGPSDDGATFDGVLPFVAGEITNWNEPYWQRVDAIVRSACAHGNTVFLYPMDGWNVGPVFGYANADDARRFGAMVANRYANFPNIAWMTGGDFFARDRHANDLFSAMLDGVRSTGNDKPFSIQLGYPKSLSTDSPFWRDRVDWNFVYTYYPTYKAVLDAYRRSGGPDPRPALLGEANYEGENNQPNSPPTTNETLRRQVLWALTSGSPGSFFGSDDWEFHPGWEARLNTPAVTQLQKIRDLFAARTWWTLVPDDQDQLVTEGRGTKLTEDVEQDVLDNDYATGARSPDGSWAVIYVPTARTLTIDTSRFSLPWTANWIDPADASGPPTAAVIDGGRVTTPRANSDGGPDWLLLIEAGH